MNEQPSLLQVLDLCKHFQTTAERLEVLNHVNLTMNAGDDMSIVGPSGSGKSTLLYILGTLDHPSSGEIRVAGVNPFELSNQQLAKFRNQSIGFVFQDHHLLPQLSVLENVLLPALAHGQPSQDELLRGQQLLESVGLADRMHHLPAAISGGERQRAAVARAMLNRPRLLLADEPTGNLDALSSGLVADMLYDLPKREGTILIVVTHSQVVAERASRKMRLIEKTLVDY